MSSRKFSLTSFGILLLALLGVVGCSIEDEEAALLFQDQVRFFTVLETPLEQMELRAGEEGYSLNTSLNETNGVLEMKGGLKTYLAGTEFEFILRNKGSITSSSPEIAPLYYPLATPQEVVELPLTYQVLAFAARPQPHFLYRWPQGQSLTDTLLLPAQQQLPGEMFYIEMQSLDTATCVQQVRYAVELGSNHRADMELHTNFGGNLQPQVVARSGQITSYSWQRNGLQLQDNSATLTLPQSQRKRDTLTVQLTFSDGVKMSITKVYRPAAFFIPSCDLNMRWQSTPAQEMREKNHQTAELVVIDKKGTRFSSLHNKTHGWVRLGGITPFEDNANGQPTRRFNFEGKAVLFSSQGDSLILERVHGSLAVARP